jgi:TRAP transporter 4TM/12TM fusion protein
MGGIALVVLIEAARRVSGLPIITIAVFFLFYCYLGPHMPRVFAHRGFDIERIISHMYLTTEGIIGIPTGVSASFVFMFILFGAFIEKTGVGQFFIDIANAIAGRAMAGPAKVAVVTSALQGTISGSSVANVVTTGSFTIPMMKKLGYKPEFAGATEAAASTGGQIMPPVMGAAAFLMAEFIGTSYTNIIISAALPAILYFTGVFAGVHFEGVKLGLKGLSADQIPNVWKVLKAKGHLLIPIIGIVYFLISGLTPSKAAASGVGLAIAASFIRKETRMKPKDFVEALENGAKTAVGLAVIAATAGIIVGVVTLTGLGLKMANGIVSLAGGSLFFTMFLTMISSLILGMGTPTTANYIITSTIAAPALLKLGVPIIAAHMFVFYFGIIADLTPPVCVAAFAAAGLAKGDPIKTGLIATKLAIGAWIIPYIFVYSPSILMINTTLIGALGVFCTSIFGMISIAAGVAGYFVTKSSIIERILLIIGGLVLVKPGLYTDIAGIVIVLVISYIQYKRSGKKYNIASYKEKF